MVVGTQIAGSLPGPKKCSNKVLAAPNIHLCKANEHNGAVARGIDVPSLLSFSFFSFFFFLLFLFLFFFIPADFPTFLSALPRKLINDNISAQQEE